MFWWAPNALGERYGMSLTEKRHCASLSLYEIPFLCYSQCRCVFRTMNRLPLRQMMIFSP